MELFIYEAGILNYKIRNLILIRGQFCNFFSEFKILLLKLRVPVIRIIIIALFAFMKHQRIQYHLSRSAHLQMSQNQKHIYKFFI